MGVGSGGSMSVFLFGLGEDALVGEMMMEGRSPWRVALRRREWSGGMEEEEDRASGGTAVEDEEADVGVGEVLAIDGC